MQQEMNLIPQKCVRSAQYFHQPPTREIINSVFLVERQHKNFRIRVNRGKTILPYFRSRSIVSVDSKLLKKPRDLLISTVNITTSRM